MNILIIEHAPNRVDFINRILKKNGADTTVWRPYLKPMPEGKFDGIILSGGPMSGLELEKTKEAHFYEEISFLKQKIKNADTPILGICLGHQIIAHLSGGKLTTSSGLRVGWKEILINKDDLLFKDFPQKVQIFKYHQDEVTKLPREAKLIANSSDCEIESYKLKNKPIWGIQFHPEITPIRARKIYSEKEEILNKNGYNFADLTRHGRQVYSKETSEKLFKNFLTIVKSFNNPKIVN